MQLINLDKRKEKGVEHGAECKMLKTHLHPPKIKQIVTIASKKQNKTKQKQSTLKTTFLSILIFNLDSHRFHVVTIFGLLQNTKIFVLKL